MELDFRKDSIISIISVKQLSIKGKKKKQWYRKPWDQYVYTICLLFLCFIYALCASLFSPTLVDMKYLFHTSLNNVGYVNTFKNVGYLIGCLLGLLYAYINRQLAIAAMMCLMGVFTALVPFCSNLWQLYLTTVICFIGGGAFGAGGMAWFVDIWGVNSAPLLQLSKAAAGLGEVLGPLIDEPFIRGKVNLNNVTQYHNNSTLIDMATDKLNDSIERRSKLQYPFIIGGVLALIIPVILFVLYFVKKYSTPVEVSDDEAVTETGVRQKNQFTPKVRYILISLLSISMSTFAGMEMAYMAYSSPYFQDIPLHFSAQTAAELASVCSTALTVGKLVATFVSIKVVPEIIIGYSFVICAIALVVIYIGTKAWVIWLGNGLIGFGFSGIWSSYFYVAEKHVGLTNNISAILQAIATLCPMISPFICGPLIEKKPQVFLLIQLGYFVVAVITFAMIAVIAKKCVKCDKRVSCNVEVVRM